MDPGFAFALNRIGFPYQVIIDFNDNGLWSQPILLQMSEEEIDTLRSINNRAHNALVGGQPNPRRITLGHVRLLKAYRYTLMLSERVFNTDVIQVGAERLRK